MADDSNRIGSSRGGSSGMDLLRELGRIGGVGGGGGGASPSAVTGVDGVSSTSGSGGGGRSGMGGPRGSRVLPADFPVDQLDRQAARGTYIDLLV